MLTALKFLFGWLSAGPLDRILDTVDKKVDSETAREQIKTDAVKAYLQAQVAILTGRGWFFPLFFLAPAGFWFAAVCVYSVFFCQSCMLPQDWSIAALPSPLNDWIGAMIGSLFIGKAGGELIARLKR